MVKEQQMTNAVFFCSHIPFFSSADPSLVVYRNSVKDVIVS